MDGTLKTQNRRTPRLAIKCLALAAIIGAGDCAQCVAPPGTSGFDTQAWADKYIKEYGTTPAIACHTDGLVTVTGIWRPDDPAVAEWANLPPDHDEKGNCVFCDYPNNEYEYCDSSAGGLVMCIGASLNLDFVSADGYAGQDCESWRHLSLYMEGLETIEDLEEVCRASSAGNRQLGRGGRQPLVPQRYTFDSVVGPEGGRWADKYITRRATRKVLKCDRENVYKVIGYWNLDSRQGKMWKKANDTSALKRACNLVDYPDNEYEYCNDTVETDRWCSSGILNETFFLTDGEPGQSCVDWYYLTEYFLDPSALDSLRLLCSDGGVSRKLPGCQEDTTVGIDRDACGVVAYDTFKTRFVSSATGKQHFHLHYWNIDSLDDRTFATLGLSNLKYHPGFVSCFDNYQWGSTWNRPQMCVEKGQPNWWTQHDVPAASNSCTGNLEKGGTSYPIMNVATRMKGTVKLVNAGPGPEQYKQCPTNPDSTINGQTLVPDGAWCLFRALSRNFTSTTTRRGDFRDICGCSKTAAKYNNNGALSRSHDCPQ